jgi:hypothetical protein
MPLAYIVHWLRTVPQQVTDLNRKQVTISAFQKKNREQTVCFLHEVRNKIRLVGVMKRGDREFELVGELQFKAENISCVLGCVWRLT